MKSVFICNYVAIASELCELGKLNLKIDYMLNIVSPCQKCDYSWSFSIIAASFYVVRIGANRNFAHKHIMISLTIVLLFFVPIIFFFLYYFLSLFQFLLIICFSFFSFCLRQVFQSYHTTKNDKWRLTYDYYIQV